MAAARPVYINTDQRSGAPHQPPHRGHADTLQPSMMRVTQLSLFLLATFLVSGTSTAPTTGTEDGEDQNLDQNLEYEALLEDADTEAEPVYTKEKRLFEDFFENQTKMERLESIRALKEKNRHDQKRRRAERQRRKTKPRHQGKKNRVNRNTKR